MSNVGAESTMLGVALLLLACRAADAQPVAATLQDLRHLTSETVTVTDGNGHDYRGAMTDASESRLCLRIGREPRCFDAGDVAVVRVRKQDSPGNGALIGAAVGAGVTSLIFLDNECRVEPACYAAVAFYGGVGLTAGLIIDALIHRSLVVYSRPSRPGPTLSVGPMIGSRGVRLALLF